MTHYWIQTWQGLCVYYITRHWPHLSFITYIAPPHQAGEKGEREGNIFLDPSDALRLLFPPGQTDTPPSAPHHTARLSLSLFFFYPPVEPFLHWEPVRYNNTVVGAGTPRTILPTGILEEISKTQVTILHPRHSHMNEVCCVDVRAIDKCNFNAFWCYCRCCCCCSCAGFCNMNLIQPKNENS